MDDAVSRFKIGATGVLLGTDVEVLGWARWRTADGYISHEVTLRTVDAERWTLELDAGHALLIKELPEIDLGDPLAPQPLSKIELMGVKRVAWDFCRSRLEHIEGEYWKDMAVGTEVVTRAFWSRPTGLLATTVLEPGSPSPVAPDWEWAEAVYIDPKELRSAFGVTLAKATEPHQARPYPYTPWMRALGPMFVLAGVFGIVSAFFIGGGTGAALLSNTVNLEASEGMGFVGVLDSEKAQIVGAELSASGMDQSWLYTDLRIGPMPEDSGSQEVAEPTAMGSIQSEFSSYSGYDSEGSWSEASRSSATGLRVNEGSYAVWLLWEAEATSPLPLKVNVRLVQGHVERGPLFVWSGFALLIGFIFWMVRRSHNHKVQMNAGLRVEDD